MNTYIIKNVRLVDGTSTNLLIKDGIIKQIRQQISHTDIPTLTLEDNCYLSAGWIDMHTHCFEKYQIYSDDCDTIGYQTGVTTVVDAGTAGADTMEEFYNSLQDKKTNVYAFINLARTGIFVQNELENLDHLDTQLLKQIYKKYHSFIVGIKIRSSKSVVGTAGNRPLEIGLQVANETSLPLMVHIGTAPTTLETVISKLRPKDIITHIFNPKENGIATTDGMLKPCVKEALNKGIYLDIGHGTDSFAFRTLDIANNYKLKVDTISTDIYSRNRKNGPVYDMATTMSKFLHRGYTLTEVIDRVTKNPATILGLTHIGEIKEGKQADFTIFKMVKGKKEVIDSVGQKEIISEYIQPLSVILKGEYILLGEK